MVQALTLSSYDIKFFQLDTLLIAFFSHLLGLIEYYLVFQLYRLRSSTTHQLLHPSLTYPIIIIKV